MGTVATMTASGSMASLHNEPVRLLQRYEKMKSRFDSLHALSDASFEGPERPPHDVLKHAYLNSDVFVKEFGGNLVGFAIVVMRGDEPYLWSIAVDKMYRNCGVGAQILAAIESHYTNERKNFIDLTCRVDNSAQMLYFRNGYRVTGVAKNFYEAGGDGLMMRLELSQSKTAA